MATETVSVLAYNVSDALSNGQKMPALLDQVTIHQPSVAVFSEAYKAETGILDDAFEDFDMLGYLPMRIDQEAVDDRPDAHGLVVIARRELLDKLGPVKLADRYALLARMVTPETNEPFTFIGHHGNDKNDELRTADVQSLIDHILRLKMTENGSPTVVRPTIYAGDHNTMPRKGILPAVLRAAGPFVDALPSVPPNPAEKQPWLKKKAGLAQRLSRMAIGEPLEMLRAVGLEDIDTTNEPTMRKMGLAVKIDHILASRHFEVVGHQVLRGITVDGDVNGERLSDHDAILGTLHLSRPASS